jgi:hypothetical protein
MARASVKVADAEVREYRTETGERISTRWLVRA